MKLAHTKNARQTTTIYFHSHFFPTTTPGT
jgi:hypothetical protein